MNSIQTSCSPEGKDKRDEEIEVREREREREVFYLLYIIKRYIFSFLCYHLLSILIFQRCCYADIKNNS